MAFNIVDQNDNHRGIVLGRFSFDSDLVEKDCNILWVAGLTKYRVEDFGLDLYHLEQIWAEKWKLKDDYGINSKRFSERIKNMTKVHKREELNYEEQLRFLHTWHSWKKMKEDIEQKIAPYGYILINPMLATIKDNKMVVDMPHEYPEPVKDKGISPVYLKISEHPVLKVSLIYNDRMREKIPIYSTKVTSKSGNSMFSLSLPFAITNARKGDFIQLFWHEKELSAVFVNGLFYEVENKAFNFFGF
ncbi:hypothetical protein IMX26_10305 [Clostridium sp. 'deep sea']|uniref:hypothetical protein n=1 Tax=Clostridium sp. 'deep sea' TaxID=2779445 RepID=UPI00189642B5|nr:hypothetical protein [Clostridium sp. 'deep sea']QOR33883.1 hypothetical protein IMX26_10305 [Clostridium sp. 'deep sea']